MLILAAPRDLPAVPALPLFDGAAIAIDAPTTIASAASGPIHFLESLTFSLLLRVSRQPRRFADQHRQPACEISEARLSVL
jgi:hypothetical protein